METVDAHLLIRLLNEHGDALVLYAQQWCREPEDVVQEAFVRLMRQRPSPESPKAWLYRVVRNTALSSSRSESRRSRHESAARKNRVPWFAPRYDEAVDSIAAAKDLATLNDAQREAIVLRIWGGLSLKQIAQITDTSTSTVHRNYVAGLAALRDKWSVTCRESRDAT